MLKTSFDSFFVFRFPFAANKRKFATSVFWPLLFPLMYIYKDRYVYIYVRKQNLKFKLAKKFTKTAFEKL
jgi:hypothetical protein